MKAPTAARRAQLIRLIHVARKDLQMPEDTYRGILLRVGGASSAADLKVQQLEAVLQHMKAAGFKVRPKRPGPARSRPLDMHDTSRKIRALWLLLHELGAVRDSSEHALGAYCRRQVGVEALQWLDSAQAHQVIEALKKWALRYLPDALQRQRQALAALKISDFDDQRCHAAWNRAFTRCTFDPMWAAYELFSDLIREGGSHV